MTKGSFWKSILPAAVLIAVFAVAFFLGRNTVPYEISISAERLTLPAESELSRVEQMPPKSIERTMPETAADSEKKQLDADKLDLNLASKDDFMILPGIGEKLAERILEYRETAGRFSAPEQIMDVEGIGEGIFEKIRDSITVGDIQ